MVNGYFTERGILPEKNKKNEVLPSFLKKEKDDDAIKFIFLAETFRSLSNSEVVCLK